jgi:hypothetical protein
MQYRNGIFGCRFFSRTMPLGLIVNATGDKKPTVCIACLIRTVAAGHRDKPGISGAQESFE